MRLEVASYLDAVEEEAARLVDAPVPIGAVAPGRSNPMLEILDRGRAAIERATGALAGAPVERPARERLDLDTLADEFVRLAGANSAREDLSRIAGQLAIELTLCRVDLGLTEGEVTPLDSELALDAVATRLEALRDGPPLSIESLKGSLALVSEDAPDAFLIEVARHQLRFRTRRGPADSVVVAPASQLFLLVYGRAEPDALRVTGSRRVLDAFARAVGPTDPARAL